MWAVPSHGLGSQDEEKEESELRVKDQRPLLCSPTVAARGTSCFTLQPPRRELHSSPQLCVCWTAPSNCEPNKAFSPYIPSLGPLSAAMLEATGTCGGARHGCR